MGTRNLTAVYIDGEYKVAQYGQWDGYPEGQGMTALQFLRDKMDVDMFKTALRKCGHISDKELDNLWKQYGADDTGFVSMKASDAFKKVHPEFSRDTGAEVLEIIQNHPEGIKLHSQVEFAADSLFCEWAWVVDFDAGTFEGYRGFNETPLTKKDRFYFLRDKEDGDYHGVRMAAKWDLDKLPSDDDFLAAFATNDDD